MSESVWDFLYVQSGVRLRNDLTCVQTNYFEENLSVGLSPTFADHISIQCRTLSDNSDDVKTRKKCSINLTHAQINYFEGNLSVGPSPTFEEIIM